MGFEKHSSLSQYQHFERQLTWPIRYLMEMHNVKATVKTWKVLSQRLLWVRITESENLDKMKLETEIWVYQKRDGIVRALTEVAGGNVRFSRWSIRTADPPAHKKKNPVSEIIHSVKCSQGFIKEGDGRRAPELPYHNQILPVMLTVPQRKTRANHGIYWFVWNMFSLVSHYASGKLSFHCAWLSHIEDVRRSWDSIMYS